ncbi:MAG: hypothetical protein KBT29_02860 [Prevotellaceae bacterium]|nr:hypothetical protein [Candidatus Minthosoma caballi]
MKRRNPFSDLGLVIAVSAFICILVKCLLFGFTWVSIAWILISCVYFFISWKFPSEGKIVKTSTLFFLILSVCAAVSVVLFDKNAQPQMHAFEGNGDTIADEQVVEVNQKVTMYDTLPQDTTKRIVNDSVSVNSEGTENETEATPIMPAEIVEQADSALVQ